MLLNEPSMKRQYYAQNENKSIRASEQLQNSMQYRRNSENTQNVYLIGMVTSTNTWWH